MSKQEERPGGKLPGTGQGMAVYWKHNVVGGHPRQVKSVTCSIVEQSALASSVNEQVTSALTSQRGVGMSMPAEGRGEGTVVTGGTGAGAGVGRGVGLGVIEMSYSLRRRSQ